MAILISYPTCWFSGVTCQLLQVRGTTYPDTVNTERFILGETISVNCDQGYWFSFLDQRSQKTIHCTESGEWDTAPTCQGRQHYFHAPISCRCINVLRIVVLLREPTRSSRSFRFDWSVFFFNNCNQVKVNQITLHGNLYWELCKCHIVCFGKTIMTDYKFPLKQNCASLFR